MSGRRIEQLVAAGVLVYLVGVLTLGLGLLGAAAGIGCALLGSILARPATRGDSHP